jgi:hypothetical protein
MVSHIKHLYYIPKPASDKRGIVNNLCGCDKAVKHRNSV